MAIATVNVLVPASGDGPVAVVANLVGPKTVVLSGYFQGTYVLLASHDNATFVPVLTFDSDGLEEIRQTLSEAYVSVRVRAGANTVPASIVAMSVSGLSDPGANMFAVVASLAAGSSGPQPTFDTAIPFPPSGLEEDVNFICAGSLLGTIIIEGSTNNVDFNQIGSFQAGPQRRTLLGLSQSLEFSPLPTADKVRYVRVNIQGQILGPTVITMGGSIPTGAAPSSTTLAQAYNNGVVAADQMLVENDARGGGVVVDGSSIGFTGTNAFDVKAAGGGEVAFPRVGGLSVVSNISRAAGPAVVWDEASFRASSLTLTGPPAAISTLAMVRVERGVIQGIGNTVSDAYDLLVNQPPSGSATITRSWSVGAAGAIQAQQGLVLGAGISPPGESDLAVGPGATILSQANTGRLGYLAGGTQGFMVSANGGAYVPLLTAPLPGGFTQGSVPFGSATGTLVEDNANLFWDETNKSLGVDVAAAPTARIHVAGVTVAAGTASLKLEPGTLMALTESGAVESDGVDLWWTTALGVRVKLNNSAATLAAVYAAGAAAPDQTMVVLDAKGGGIAVNATTPLQTFVTAFEIDVVGGSVNFYRVGGFDVASTISKAAAAGTTWNEVALLSSTLTLTGGPTTVTAASMVRVGQGSLNGPGIMVTDAYDLFVEAAPIGTATLTRAWSAGFAGAVQAPAGLVLGKASLPPTESDLVVEAGATVVSQPSTGRLGYLAGGTQSFMVSTNGGAYVPLLVAPAPGGFTPGSVPFGSATGTLTQDNADLFWDDTNKYLGVGTNGPSARFTVAGGTYVDALGTRDHILATATFAPVGGIAAFSELDLQYAVDQTGGANGRVVGLMIAATETAVVGSHYPIDVFAGAGGVTEIFRLTSSGTVQTKQGMTLGLGLTAPGESDIAFEAGATNLSQANTGRIGYRTSTQQFYASMNGGAYVPLATGTISVTLAQAYAFGAVAADQTFALLDAKGGGLVVDGTAAGFTGANALAVNGAAAGFVLFPRAGGMSVVSSVSVAAAVGSTWDEVSLLGSALTLTSGPATSTRVAEVHVGQGTVNGAGNTVTDAYDLLVDAAPAGTATLTRSWSAGFVGAAQAQAGLVLGAGLAPPAENDLVVGAGATNVSVANTGRLGYLAGFTQQFMVSMNGGAYVPLLVGPSATGFTAGSVPFGSATGTLTQDNADFFWDNTNKTLLLDGAATNATSALVLSINKTLAAPAAGSVWDGFKIQDSTLTATMGAGNVTVTELVGSHFHQPTIATAGGAGLLTVTDAYTVRIGAPPVGTGSATLTNAWSLGVTGAVKLLSLILIQPAAVSSGTFTGFTQIAAAHTNLTAGAEVPDTNFNLSATKTWATGAIATQRDFIVRARTYAFAAPSTVTTAATVAITGAPITGANATITNPLSLWSQNGQVQLNSASSVLVDVLNLSATSVGRAAIGLTMSSGTVSVCRIGNVFAAGDTWINSFAAIRLGTGGATLGTNERFTIASNGNVGINVPTPANSSVLQIDASKTASSASGAWNGINVAASTLTLTGAVTPITSLALFTIIGPTVNAGSAIVTTDFYTCRIGSATFGGAGPASAARNWSLRVDGNTLFDGGQTVAVTDVNGAGPYNVLDTDYYLQIRRTATAAITVNLPAAASMRSGHVVISADSGYNAAVNPITLVPSGADKIANVAGNYTQNVSGSVLKLTYNATTSNWEIS